MDDHPAIIGDLHQIIPALIEALQRHREGRPPG